MATKNTVVENLMRKAELIFGFKFACDLHGALKRNEPEARVMLRKVLAA